MPRNGREGRGRVGRAGKNRREGIEEERIGRKGREEGMGWERGFLASACVSW